MKKILTIAGSDCSGGAGIQADIKTITAHKMYAMSAITALTAQNTTGVYGILCASPEFVGSQLDCIFTDIPPDAIKIGMVSNSGIIRKIAEKLLEYNAKNIVVDPVMIATSGSKLLDDDSVCALKECLFPIANLITPNIPEAISLSGLNFPLLHSFSKDDMLHAAKIISKINDNVLIKGGHLNDCADDLLVSGSKLYWFREARLKNSSLHGTGCTLSSAIACNLAAGLSVKESVINAKKYVTGAILDGLSLGEGSSPLNHCYNLN